MTAVTRNIRVDDKNVRRMLKGIRATAADFRDGFREFQQYMRVVTERTFARNRLGGTSRGVRWKYFAPMYTRKDGTVVPAWGGIKKARGKGNVLGRIRRPGVRLKQGDALLDSTSTLKGRATLTQRIDGRSITMGPGGLVYAAYQDRMRPFLFFETPKDLNVLTKILVRRIREGARRGHA